MSDIKLRPAAFPEYKRLATTKLLAEASTLEVAGHTIIVAGANRATLINILNGIAPDIAWSKELSAPISITFLKKEEPAAK